jgi:hypothetical protein
MMFKYIKEQIIRLRTWIVNILFAILITPEIVMVLLGANWGSIIPEPYINYVTIAIPIINIWMRPRLAVLPSDPEAKIAKIIRDEDPIENI